MSDKVFAAIIAAGVSLIVSLITYFSTRQKLNFEVQNLNKQLARQLSVMLYEKRFEHYGNAFDITDRIQPSVNGVILGGQKHLQDVREDLRNWKKGQVSLIISGDSLQSFRELERALGSGPAGVAGDPNAYTESQRDKVITARDSFRRSLRRDVAPLHVSEIFERKDRKLK